MNFVFKYPIQFLFFLSFLVRILFWLFFTIDNELGSDSLEYLGVAKNILNGLGFWNSERGGELYFSEPVYPLLAAFFMFITNNIKIIIIAQSIISSISSIVFYSLMRDLSFSNKISFFATILLILHPYINFYNSLFLPESLRVFALLLVIKFAFKLKKEMNSKNLLYFGLICGFSSLVRFPFGFMIPLFSLYFLIFIKDNAIKNILIYLSASILVLSPWYLRNYSVQGSISKYSILDRFSNGLKPETIYRLTDQDKYYKKMGGNRGVIKDEVIDHDLRKKNRGVLALKMIFLRLKEFYKFYPTSSDFSVLDRLLASIFNIPIFTFGFLGLFKLVKDKKFDIFFFFVIPFIILTLVHTISNTNDSRYSLPLVPIQIILSFIFIKDYLSRLKSFV